MTDRIELSAGVLSLLRHVRKDDPGILFGTRRVIYVTDYPDIELLESRGLALTSPMDTTKKMALFERLPKGALLLSPGVLGADAQRRGFGWHSGRTLGRVIHLSTLDYPFVRRFYAAAAIFCRLLALRRQYDAILCYNSYGHTFLPSLLASWLSICPLYIDWEDDYRLQSGNLLTRSLWPLARRFSSGGIAVNPRMLDPGMDNWIVVEAYCDVSYAAELQFQFHPGIKLLFSGTLDHIRGAHLVPELVAQLSALIGDFTLDITGGGELADEMRALSASDPRVRFHGFVDQTRLLGLVDESDACLVLQDPRSKFNNGSFPSKIHLYAEHRKPVFMIGRHDA